MDQPSSPAVSPVVLGVQFVEELAGGRPDTNTVDVGQFEVVGSGPEGHPVDEDAADDGVNGLHSVPIDDGRHQLIEMGVTVVRSRLLRSFQNEVDDIRNRRVIGIPRSLTNVVERLSIRHFESLRGVVRISRRRLGVSVPTDRSESLLKRIHTLDPREFIVDLVDESGTLNGVLVARNRVD